MAGRRWRVLQWLVALALVALFLSLGDVSQLGRLKGVSWPWLGAVLLSSAALVWSAAGRWRILAVGVAGAGAASPVQYAYYFLLGRLLGFVFPAEATDVGVRTLALRRTEKMSLAGAAYTVLLDRLLDLVVLIWLVVPALLHLAGWIGQRTALGIAFAGIALVPLAIGSRYRAALGGLARFYGWAVGLLRFVPGLRRAGVPELGRGDESGLDRAMALRVYVLSVAKLTAVVARFYFVARALSIPVSVPTALICVPLAQVAALVAVTPGGLGILEFGWYGILRWAGMGEAESTLLVLGWRLYTLASLVVLVLGLRLREALAAGRGRDRGSRADG